MHGCLRDEPGVCPLSPLPAVVTVVVLEIRMVLQQEAVRKLQLQIEKGGDGADLLSKSEKSLVDAAGGKAGKRGRRGTILSSVGGVSVEMTAMGNPRKDFVPPDMANVITEVCAHAHC
jgi:hypothetical protein